MIFITVFLSICCGFVGCFPLKQQVDVAEFERELAGLRSTDDNGQFITPSVQLCSSAPGIIRDKVHWRGTVVERRSLTGELSLSCARPAADG